MEDLPDDILDNCVQQYLTFCHSAPKAERDPGPLKEMHLSRYKKLRTAFFRDNITSLTVKADLAKYVISVEYTYQNQALKDDTRLETVNRIKLSEMRKNRPKIEFNENDIVPMSASHNWQSVYGQNKLLSELEGAIHCVYYTYQHTKPAVGGRDAYDAFNSVLGPLGITVNYEWYTEAGNIHYYTGIPRFILDTPEWYELVKNSVDVLGLAASLPSSLVPKIEPTVSSSDTVKQDHGKIIDIFISYDTKDVERFQIPHVATLLEKYPGINHVYYWQKHASGSLLEYMEEYIKKAEVVLFFCSPHALKSKPVITERNLAFTLEKHRIPIFESIEQVWDVLKNERGVEHQGNVEEIVKKITQIIQLMINDR